MIWPGSPTEGEMKLVLLYQGKESGLETVWLNLSGVSAKPGVGAGGGGWGLEEGGGGGETSRACSSYSLRTVGGWGGHHAPCRLDRS